MSLYVDDTILFTENPESSPQKLTELMKAFGTGPGLQTQPHSFTLGSHQQEKKIS